MKKKNEAGHNPFSSLQSLYKEKKQEEKKHKWEKPPTTAPTKPKKPKHEWTDEEYFFKEVKDAQPIEKDSYFERELVESPSFLTEDEESFLWMDQSEYGDFTVFANDEHIEGHLFDLDPKLFGKLKRSEFTIEATLDLHGFNVKESQGIVSSFFQEQQQKKRRCVLIIHGRGLHSEGQQAVLKNELLLWITKGFLRKKILAFCPARPSDGGTGALLLLLRKQR